MSCLKVSFIIATMWMVSPASGAVITGAIAGANLIAPSGGGVSNSLRLIVSPELIKLVGTAGFTTRQTTDITTRTSSTRGSELSLDGEVTLGSGDAFTLAYDYDVTLVGGGTVNLTTTAITNFGGQEEILSSTETITSPGTFNFRFTELGFTADRSVEGTWTGLFTIDWIDAPDNSSLNIVIPNDSIDFTVTNVVAVPEPGTFAVLGIVSLGAFVYSRRRRSAQ